MRRKKGEGVDRLRKKGREKAEEEEEEEGEKERFTGQKYLQCNTCLDAL